MTPEMINERVQMLREEMRRESIDAFIFPSTDPHNGEYVPDHWKGREWISGFDGSAGTAVVTLHEAALWTDSRYFIAAEAQLAGTEFQLMKMKMPGTPSIPEWIARKLAVNGGSCVGIDGMVNTASDVKEYADTLRHSGITVRTNYDPLRVIWTDRPAVPLNPVEIHPIQYAGEACESKLKRIRQAISEAHAEAHLITALDDIAWTLNLRGTDVHCCPVFVSYLLITDKDVTLFVDDRKLTAEVREYLVHNNIKVRRYEDVVDAVRATGRNDQRLLVDSSTTCHTLCSVSGVKYVEGTSPIPAMKIMKNTVEIAGYRSAMLRDGVAMVKFLSRLKADGVMSEVGVDRHLTSLRAEQKGFRDISFDTIAGYAEHGAIVHYEATPETDAVLQPRSFLLLDSGGHYTDGTTDITRTIPLGPLTDEERRVYTLVLKGHIALSMVKFPDGASGTQIDALARQFMWQEGMNYLHGTGHGVGSYLSVHEGPHQIRMEWKPQPLRAGMTVTNEPGLYLAGRFGVRIENTMLITDYKETEFGRFLQLEPLTLCPIATSPIVMDMMTAAEIAWLNDYHRHVREQLLPLLTDEAERTWLETATAPLTSQP